MAELDRIKWQCRRGMLELDLILEKFSRRHLGNLDPDQLERFKELLAYPDNDLLDMVMERAAAPGHGYNAVMQLLRTV